MRLLSLFKKAMVENFRDWKMLSLTVTFAPFFVFLMHAYFNEASEPYRVVVVNRDVGVPAPDFGAMSAGELLIDRLTEATYPEGGLIFRMEESQDLDRARSRLETQSVDLVVEIPERFSAVLLEYQVGGDPPPTVIKTYGDPSNPSYLMAAVWSDMLTYEYTASLTGASGPLVVQPETTGSVDSLTEYQLYVPGLLALAIMMLMFTAAGTLIREKDQGTLVRLRMSKMTTLEWLIAVSMVQIILGVVDVGLTLLAAMALGYETTGSMMALAVVTALSSLSIMAFSVIVAASLRTIFDLVTIGCFPFFILMFFSGGMFPLPNVRVFDLGSRPVNLNDILPTTHTIDAYNRILNYDAGLGDVGYEIAAITLLTLVFFALGTWLFARRHMRAA
jgi:ABC-2 type transport system permease protein